MILVQGRGFVAYPNTILWKKAKMKISLLLFNLSIDSTWLSSVLWSERSISSHLDKLLPLECAPISRTFLLIVSGDQTSGSDRASGEPSPSWPLIQSERWRADPLLIPDFPSCRQRCSISSVTVTGLGSTWKRERQILK